MRSCSRRSADGSCATLDGRPRQPSCASTSRVGVRPRALAAVSSRASSSSLGPCGTTVSFGGTIPVPLFFAVFSSGHSDTASGHALPGGIRARACACRWGRTAPPATARPAPRAPSPAWRRTSLPAPCARCRARRRTARRNRSSCTQSPAPSPSSASSRVARLLDRPHRAPRHHVHALDRALALVGVGLEQVEDHRRVLAHADGAHALGVAAREHVAAEPLARHQLGRRRCAWPRAASGGTPAAPPAPRRWAGPPPCRSSRGSSSLDLRNASHAAITR